MSHHDVFSSTGFIRLARILAPTGPIPVGKSTWWEGVRSGRFPQPIKLGPRITAWRVEDIQALITNGLSSAPSDDGAPAHKGLSSEEADK